MSTASTYFDACKDWRTADYCTVPTASSLGPCAQAWFSDKRNLFEKPWQALSHFEKKLEAASVEVPTSSLGSCFFQLSCVISIWAMLQQQPCLWLAVCPIDLDPDLNLQTWFCRFDLGPASSQQTYLAIYTLGWPWLLSPDLPYSLSFPYCGGAPLAGKVLPALSWLSGSRLYFLVCPCCSLTCSS